MATPPVLPSGLLDAARAAFPAGVPPPAPTPGLDPITLQARFKEWYDECFDLRFSMERLWWRNLLYTLGRQWIYYDRTRSQWQDKRLAKWIPKPVTNKTAEVVSAIRSVFQQVQLSAVVRPAGRAPADVSTAETASLLAPLLHREHRLDAMLNEHDFWLVVTGNAFLHPWWDKAADNGVEVVTYERCVTCGSVVSPAQITEMRLCPTCGGDVFGPAVDPQTGQPMEKRLPIGRGRTDVCAPMEIAVPSAATCLDEAYVLIRQRWRTKRWIEARLPQLARKVQWEHSPQERSLQLFKSLAQQSELPSSPLWFGQGESANQTALGISEYEVWLRPNQEYPDGLVARFLGRANPLVVEDDAQGLPGPLPFETVTGTKLFPWIHTAYETFGGRFWARSPLDLIIQPQDKLNQIDSLIQLIIQRVANPVWLEPKGAEVKSFTGEPGLVVKYQPLIAGGLAKPERLAGENVPSSLIQIREQAVADIESLAGTYDVIKGSKPTGVEAFSALQLLVERSQSRFSSPLASRGRMYQDWYACAIELERQFGPTERSDAILGPNKSYTYETFRNANLQGAVRVIVEDGATTPKTNLGMRAAVEQLQQMGMIDPQNPDQRYAIYQQFGVTDLQPGLDANVKSALQEQEAFEQWAMSDASSPEQMQAYLQAQQMQAQAQAIDPMSPLPPLPPFSPLSHEVWHDPAIHLAEHIKWANADAVRQILEVKPYLKTVLTQHIVDTQTAQLLTQQTTQGPAPQTRGGQAMGNANKAGSPKEPRGQGEGNQGRGPE